MKNKVALDPALLTRDFLLIAFFLSYVFSYLQVSLFFVGLLSSIIFYDSIHYYCHFGPDINIGWLKNLRINHLKHHYKNQDKYFGVTNTIWDDICGTGEVVNKNKK